MTAREETRRERERAKERETEKEREAKDNNVFDEEWHYSRGRRPSRYELHWRLKLVRDGKKKRRKKRQKKRKESKKGDLGLSEVPGFAY